MAQNNTRLMDKLMLAVAGFSILAAVYFFQFYAEKEIYFRVIILLAGLLFGVVIGCLTLPGKNFIGFFKDSIQEMRKVVWPTKKETFQTVLIVFVFVLLVSIFLWIADKSFEWLLYDLVLGWK